MVYTLTTGISLGAGYAGLTLSAQLKDTTGSDVGSAVTTGFVDLDDGLYSWTYASFPDGFRGMAVFSSGGSNLAATAINPEEAENLDAKVSTRASQTSLDTVDNFIDTEIADIQARLPAALVSGRIDASVGAMASGVVTATAIAADAIGASELAADAVTEIQSGLATAAALATVDDFLDTEMAAVLAAVDSEVAAIKAKTDQLTFTATNKVDATIQAAGDFAQGAADKVWSTAARALTDKAGFSLSAAGIQAIWDALTAALTTASSIGKLLVDNINATISSRASQASLDTVDGIVDAILVDTAEIGAAGAGLTALATQASVNTIDDFLDTEVAAIKAKTDNLPADPADASDIAAAFAVTNGKIDTVDDFLDTEIAAIKAKTDLIPASPAATGDAMTLTSGAVDAILDDAIGDSTLTMRQALRVLVAGMAGKLSGAATASITIRNVADSANVIVATVDADGNRSAVVVTP